MQTELFEPIHLRRTEPGGGFVAASLFAVSPARMRGAAQAGMEPPGGWLVAAAAESAALREAEAAAVARATAARAEGWEEGFAAGRAAGLAEAAERDAARLAAAAETVAATLREATGSARAVAAAHAEEAAEALARLLLAALDAALPRAAAEREAAASRLAALIATLRAPLAEEPRVLVHVAPELAEPMAAHLAALDARFEVAADETLAPGDARLEWRGGSAEVVMEERRRVVRAALSVLGLEG
ncbi:MAG: hypothetical protein IRZ13_10975 [Acetobacteraceae bacterium]|nr:hypothetical protein [Acetobacteraceae bacterium]